MTEFPASSEIQISAEKVPHTTHTLQHIKQPVRSSPSRSRECNRTNLSRSVALIASMVNPTQRRALPHSHRTVRARRCACRLWKCTQNRSDMITTVLPLHHRLLHRFCKKPHDLSFNALRVCYGVSRRLLKPDEPGFIVFKLHKRR